MYFTKMKNLNVVPCNYFYTILFFLKVLILVVLSNFSPFFLEWICALESSNTDTDKPECFEKAYLQGVLLKVYYQGLAQKIFRNSIP